MSENGTDHEQLRQDHYWQLARLEESEEGTSSGGESHFGDEAKKIGRRLIDDASATTDDSEAQSD